VTCRSPRALGASPPPPAAELGSTRVRPRMNWPKSDKSDFGWRAREGAGMKIRAVRPLPTRPHAEEPRDSAASRSMRPPPSFETRPRLSLRSAGAAPQDEGGNSGRVILSPVIARLDPAIHPLQMNSLFSMDAKHDRAVGLMLRSPRGSRPALVLRSDRSRAERGGGRVSKGEGERLEPSVRPHPSRRRHTQVGFTRLAHLSSRSRVNPRSVCRLLR
jgi:hypothetical protein